MAATVKSGLTMKVALDGYRDAIVEYLGQNEFISNDFHEVGHLRLICIDFGAEEWEIKRREDEAIAIVSENRKMLRLLNPFDATA